MTKTYKPWFTTAKELMTAGGVSYQDLADILGVEKSTVGHWMTGRNKPRIETIIKIAEKLGVTVSELTGEDKYFIVDETERATIDALREMDPAERAALVRLITGAKKPE